MPARPVSVSPSLRLLYFFFSVVFTYEHIDMYECLHEEPRVRENRKCKRVGGQ